MSSTVVVGRIPLALSAIVGAIICILADLLQKSEASAVLLIGQKIDELFSGVSQSKVIAIGLVLILAIALSIIFESTTKARAFYLGASVLAILMTATPYKIPDGFKTTPNSVEVNLSVSSEDGKSLSGALVTLQDVASGVTIARTKLPGSEFRFYQHEGTYRLTVELAGYQVDSRTLSLREGSPQSLPIKLKSSSTPLFIQRVIR